MIEEIEKAVSNRSSCTKCKKRIALGSLRGIEHERSFRYMSTNYFCSKCTKLILEQQLKDIKKMLNQFK
jgi:hypothetical protein